MKMFQKLTPHISEVKNIYKEAFNFIFSNEEIKNIAISGAYGAGKSSVFESYMEKFKNEEKVIHISLAHFEQLENLGKCSRLEDEARLEAKIINQLIHQIDPKLISKTGFTAQIKNISWQEGFKLFGILLASIIPFFIIFGKKLEPFISNLTLKFMSDIFLFFRTSTGLLILSVFFLVIIFLLILSLLQHSRGNNLLKSFSLKDLSLEVSDKKHESFFDIYLSEIRYLFENSGSTIVAIEDIDRYLSSSIFEKIRELNTIINYDTNGKVIRFFYIIKDDIFTSKDRTKFFDFIVPIVPIIDSSNSYSQLISRLVENVPNLSFNKRFLRGLSIYIDDMRILKNIINEFLVYQNLLAEEYLDPNKLLAIITYKNIFPKDFNDLQLGTGYLFALINSRGALVDECLQVKQERVKEIEIEIARINNESLESIDELSTLFLKPIPNLEKVGDKRIGQFTTQLELFREIQSNPNGVFILSGRASVPKDILAELNKIKDNAVYAARKESIERKRENALDRLEKEKKEIEEYILGVQDSHLISNLITPENIDSFLHAPITNTENQYKEIINDLHYPIIRFLIRSEMIDGNYKDYLTYFYDNELQILDQRFVRSVFDEKPLPRDHKLINPEEILERIGGVSENNFACINSDLFFFVIDNRKEEETGKFLKLMQKKNSGDIIDGYLANGTELEFLITSLNLFWSSFYKDIVIKFSWSPEMKERYLKLLLIYSDSDSITNIEEINSISHEINNRGYVLEEIDDQEVDSVIRNLVKIGAKINDLDAFNLIHTLIKGIYDNNLYNLSIDNINFWLRRIYKTSINFVKGSLFSPIFSKPDEPLSMYITENLDEVVNDILNSYANYEITDNQKTIWIILDAQSVTLDDKEIYIKRLKSPVKDIRGKTDEKILNLLLEHDRVALTLNNLLTLYTVFNEEFTDPFVVYLMKHSEEWVEDNQRDTLLFSDEMNLSFFNAVLENPTLDIMVTETLLNATNIKISSPLQVINQDKAQALINSGALVMNLDNLAYLRSHYPELILYFEKENLLEFIQLLELNASVNPQEIVNLLDSDINGREQRSLISHYNGTIPYKRTYRYPGVKKYILKYKLDLSDIKEVLSDPISQNDSFFPLIKDLIVDHIESVISDQIPVPYGFFVSIITDQLLTSDQELRLFSNSIEKYSPEQIVEVTNVLQVSPFMEMFEGKHPEFVDNPVNQKILQALVKRGMAKKSILTGRLYKKNYN